MNRLQAILDATAPALIPAFHLAAQAGVFALSPWASREGRLWLLLASLAIAASTLMFAAATKDT